MESKKERKKERKKEKKERENRLILASGGNADVGETGVVQTCKLPVPK